MDNEVQVTVSNGSILGSNWTDEELDLLENAFYVGFSDASLGIQELKKVVRNKVSSICTSNKVSEEEAISIFESYWNFLSTSDSYEGLSDKNLQVMTKKELNIEEPKNN